MAPDQVEKKFPRYALAYLRYLAGERRTIPTLTPAGVYDDITAADVAAVQARVRELVDKADTNVTPAASDVSR